MGTWQVDGGRIAGLLAVTLGVLGCPPAKPPALEVYGRAPEGMTGDISTAAKEDIQLFVGAEGSAATKRHVSTSLAKQELPCTTLTYRACMTALRYGAAPGLALETQRLAQATDACKAGQPAIAFTTSPAPTTQPAVTPPPPTDDTEPVPEWRPGKFMTQALSRVVTTAQEIQKQTDYSFDSTGSAVLGTYLDAGQNVSMTRSLEGGVKYAIIGGGSDGAIDLDVGVFDDSDRMLVVDVERDNKPIVEFTPPSDGSYKIQLALPEANGGAFAAIALMRVGGYTIPMKNLIESFGNALGTARAASHEVSKQPGLAGLIFHADGDWSFYSTVLKGGQAITNSGLDLKGPASVLVGGTDGVATDIDIDVKDSDTDEEVGADREDDASPLVVLKSPNERHAYAVRISAPTSPGPSLVTLLVLRAQTDD